jgi:hypothetical protein
MKTAIEKLEALFYNEADPTINSSSWVIHESTLKKLILAAKEIEKEQIMKAYCDGAKGGANGNKGQHENGWVSIQMKENYYNQTYNQNK